MTEFDRLRDALDLAVRKQDRYIEDGQAFAERLMERFREYLQCPRDAIFMQPESTDIRSNGRSDYAAGKAVKLEDDSYFHVRFTIELTPLSLVSFPIAFKRRDRAWHVRLSRAGVEFKIDPPESEIDAEKMFRAWVNDAVGHYETMLEAFLTNGPKPPGAEIGFRSRPR